MHHGQNRGKQNKRQLRKKRKLNDNEENLEILMNLGELTNFVKIEENCNMHYWLKWEWTPLHRWINEQSDPCMKYIYSPPLKAYTNPNSSIHHFIHPSISPSIGARIRHPFHHSVAHLYHPSIHSSFMHRSYIHHSFHTNT